MDNDNQALTTDKLATLPLDHDWYQKLASNFEIIQQYLNRFDELAGKINSDRSQQSIDLNKRITDMQQQINDKINRITLGTDEDTIRLVVTAILQEQGVIK
ncbi:hypothetical protein [Lactiplantibacillus plantarum]|uniref:hypothetical protein n=1 Tax=Lactiplantibacillus plantarum TaxID=1590 RepID=UPI0032E48115